LDDVRFLLPAILRIIFVKDQGYEMEILDTEIISTIFPNSLIFIESKSDNEACSFYAKELQSNTQKPIHNIDANHAKIVRLRVKEFFNEYKSINKEE
jgi:hypothetical protein